MNKRKILIGAAAVLVLVVAGAASFRFFRPRKPNVLFIMLDTLRPDHLSVNGYERPTSPAIDAFVKENVVFPFTVGAAPWTPTSIASMFTGLYASAHGMMPPETLRDTKAKSMRLSEDLETLAEVFQKGGYQTAAVTSNPWISRALGYTQGFQSSYYFHRAPAATINKSAFKVLKGLDKSKPFFLYLHYMDPHTPYEPPGEFASMFQGELKARKYDPEMAAKINLYDGEIRYLDGQLQVLFDQLKAAGLYKDLVIVIVSDHGEQFMERGHHGHGFSLYDEEVRTLLAIKAPRSFPVTDRVVSLIDVYPTVLSLAGFSVPPAVQGISLIDEDALKARDGVMLEIKRIFTQRGYVAADGKKLILQFPNKADFLSDSATATQRLLYDQKNDPHEAQPLDDEAAKASLTGRLDLIYNQSVAFSRSKEEMVPIDPKTVDELKSLGYFSGDQQGKE